LVIFGIKESPTGTQRSDRLKADFDSSLSVLSKANKEINVQSIRDFFHLGKYKRDAIRPRPILVKLNRAMDVTDALSNRSSLPEGTTIKPDMSQEERKTESILLSQRWSLIQSGVNKKDIRIKNATLYVKGKKHGHVVDFEFRESSSNKNHSRPNNTVTPLEEYSMDLSSSGGTNKPCS